MNLAIVYVHYEWPPLSYLLGIPLGVISLVVAFVGAFAKMRNSQGKVKSATRLMWIGNVGVVVAVICWVFLGGIYVR